MQGVFRLSDDEKAALRLAELRAEWRHGVGRASSVIVDAFRAVRSQGTDQRSPIRRFISSSTKHCMSVNPLVE